MICRVTHGMAAFELSSRKHGAVCRTGRDDGTAGLHAAGGCPSVVCKHSNTHAPAARAIQPEACARVGRRGAVEAEAPTRAQ